MSLFLLVNSPVVHHVAFWPIGLVLDWGTNEDKPVSCWLLLRVEAGAIGTVCTCWMLVAVSQASKGLSVRCWFNSLKWGGGYLRSACVACFGAVGCLVKRAVALWGRSITRIVSRTVVESGSGKRVHSALQFFCCASISSRTTQWEMSIA